MLFPPKGVETLERIFPSLKRPFDPTMLGEEFTNPPTIVAVGDGKMSRNKSRAKTGIAVDESDTILVDVEAVYSGLASERRRHVLSVVRRESTPIDVRNLARQVTIQEACDNSKMVTEESIQDVHVSLNHNHLPKLAALDIIDYDTEAEAVEEITGTLR